MLMLAWGLEVSAASAWSGLLLGSEPLLSVAQEEAPHLHQAAAVS